MAAGLAAASAPLPAAASDTGAIAFTPISAIAKSRLARPVALVSGDRALYDYATYHHLADNPDVQVIYIVLPNSMHAEFTVRGARAGKHVLCEKPVANSGAEPRQKIDACRAAGRKLMIAYRSQYELMDQQIVKFAREGRLGTLRDFTAFNGQNGGGGLSQWRLSGRSRVAAAARCRPLLPQCGALSLR